MVDSNSLSKFSPSSLLCPETKTGSDNLNTNEDEEDDDEVNEYATGYDDDEGEEEYLHILLAREIRDYEQEALPQSSISDDWIKRARLDSVQWILNTRALLGFRLQTAYLSVTYFDRFLSMRMIDNEKQWAVRLLSVACLSLAAKMEECKVPALSEFRLDEYNFESNVIQRMELLVLTTLEWSMVSITPFDYLRYFLSKLCPQSSQRINVVSRIIDLIFDITKDLTLVVHRSSSIAVAATLVALDLQLTRQALEIKMNAISLDRFIEIEDVHSCYSGLLENIKLPKFVTTPELSPGGSTDVFDNFRVPSTVSTKRKRLTFSDCDQDCSFPEEKRHRHC